MKAINEDPSKMCFCSALKLFEINAFTVYLFEKLTLMEFPFVGTKNHGFQKLET